MMMWMQGNGIDVASKTPTNLEGVTTSANTGTGSGVGETGTVSTDKLNNIYDLLGNGAEWTLELFSNFGRQYRGGDYYVFPEGYGFSPSSRTALTSDDGKCFFYDAWMAAYNYSSRITLYVK